MGRAWPHRTKSRGSEYCAPRHHPSPSRARREPTLPHRCHWPGGFQCVRALKTCREAPRESGLRLHDGATTANPHRIARSRPTKAKPLATCLLKFPSFLFERGAKRRPRPARQRYRLLPGAPIARVACRLLSELRGFLEWVRYENRHSKKNNRRGHDVAE